MKRQFSPGQLADDAAYGFYVAPPDAFAPGQEKVELEPAKPPKPGGQVDLSSLSGGSGGALRLAAAEPRSEPPTVGSRTGGDTTETAATA